MNTINSPLNISDVMNEITALEVEYSANENIVYVDNTAIKQRSAMDHILDKIEALRLLISFLVPSTDECLAACLAIGNTFADRSTASEECYQTKEDRRAYERCHFSALRYLNARELPFVDRCDFHFDPLPDIEWTDNTADHKKAA